MIVFIDFIQVSSISGSRILEDGNFDISLEVVILFLYKVLIQGEVGVDGTIGYVLGQLCL